LHHLTIEFGSGADDEKTTICPLRMAAFIKATAAGYNPNEAGLNQVLRSAVPYLTKMALLAAMW